ncbi:hypothetical protein SLEP1_g29967 [Rubroshorea leprosula]|uniref:Uncharacterized protein n=1 Tax=Rubroshorea leprosula TaxID=152421 RepID=A0AAV5K7H3_9ROSI|nr:hypothetical protein SLEP1_g29967 [Rubroshorea leprosula]
MVNTRSVQTGSRVQLLGRGQAQQPNNFPPHTLNLFALVEHAEEDSLEKMVVEQRDASPLQHNTTLIPHPLNTNITLEPYPVGFKIPQLETYDGTKDLDAHQHAFYSCMQAQNASDALMCKIFPSTLRGLNHERFNDSLIKHPFATFNKIKNKMDLRRLGPMKSSAATWDHTRYCDFHQDHGHTMEEYNSLRSELESLDQKGMLNEYIQKTKQPKFVREQGSQPQGSRIVGNRQGVGFQQAPPPLPPPVRIIHMITRGLEHVLVDTGNGPDIMYYHYFESLGLDLTLLQKYDGPIYGFNNQPVQVEEVFTLNVTFRNG